MGRGGKRHGWRGKKSKPQTEKQPVYETLAFSTENKAFEAFYKVPFKIENPTLTCLASTPTRIL